MDMTVFEGRDHIPDSRLFSHLQFTNPRTERPQNAFSCDFDQCGKIFNKWHNLFDHLRIHTGEKPYHCPIDGCGLSFNQISNQKKHIATHRSLSKLTCAFCKATMTKKQLINHYDQYHGPVAAFRQSLQTQTESSCDEADDEHPKDLLFEVHSTPLSNKITFAELEPISSKLITAE